MGTKLSICGSDDNSSQISIHGDYFDASTRTILAILKINGIDTKFTEVNTLKSIEESEERRSFK
jgi:hypothetical protein